MSIIWTILIIGVLAFVHELGHFLAARSFGVRVEEFAIGMGPVILKRRGKETLYTLRALPIGGFCQMEGEEEDVSPRSFARIAPPKKLVVLLSGAAMNVLLAFILYICVNSAMPYYYSTEAAQISNPNVAVGQLQAGDVITRLDGTRINLYKDISMHMMTNSGEPIAVTALRGGEEFTTEVVPYADDTGAYKLGFVPKVEKTTAGAALKNGAYDTAFGVKAVYFSLGELISGRAGISDMSGPVGIVAVVDDTVESASDPETGGSAFWAFLSVLNLAALIGVNLGVMNLLPLPALDGGRIVFVLIEMVTRKKVSPKVEGYIHAAGMVLILAFAAVITFSDVWKLFAR